VSTDPINLVQGIYSDAGLSTTPASSTTSGSTASSNTASTTSTPDYTISPTLQAIMDRGAALGLSGANLASYNAQNLSSQVQSDQVSNLPGSGSTEATLLGQVVAYQQYATVARYSPSTITGSGSTTGSGTTSNSLDNILADSQAQGTQSATLSDQAQAILKQGQTAQADTGLASTDSNLAQIVGISRTIQGS